MRRSVAACRSCLYAAVLLIAGCSDVTLVGPPYYRGSYYPEYTAQMTMPVVVRGNPFAGEVDVGSAVVGAMQGNTWHRVNFIPAAVNAPNTYRVIVLFSPPTAFSYPNMCSAAVLPSSPQAKGSVYVSTALCQWDVLMAGASGRFTADGPDDPRFRAEMAELARALFPLRNPDDGSQNGNKSMIR
jgi:hypothetical protein